MEHEKEGKKKVGTELTQELNTRDRERSRREQIERTLREEMVELELRLQIENSGNCTRKLSESRLNEEIQTLKKKLDESQREITRNDNLQNIPQTPQSRTPGKTVTFIDQPSEIPPAQRSLTPPRDYRKEDSRSEKINRSANVSQDVEVTPWNNTTGQCRSTPYNSTMKTNRDAITNQTFGDLSGIFPQSYTQGNESGPNENEVWGLTPINHDSIQEANNNQTHQGGETGNSITTASTNPFYQPPQQNPGRSWHKIKKIAPSYGGKEEENFIQFEHELKTYLEGSDLTTLQQAAHLPMWLTGAAKEYWYSLPSDTQKVMTQALKALKKEFMGEGYMEKKAQELEQARMDIKRETPSQFCNRIRRILTMVEPRKDMHETLAKDKFLLRITNSNKNNGKRQT